MKIRVANRNASAASQRQGDRVLGATTEEVLLDERRDARFLIERRLKRVVLWHRSNRGRLLQRCHINYEPIFHVILEQPVIRLVKLLHTDCFDISGNVVLPAEIQHLLRLADTAND